MGTQFDFGEAIRRMKNGQKVCREGWNGKGMWIALVEPKEKTASGLSAYINGLPDPVPTHPFIAMKTAQNTLVPWLASQTDMLAEDWLIVE